MGRYEDIGERVIMSEVKVGDLKYLERNGEGIYEEIGKLW